MNKFLVLFLLAFSLSIYDIHAECADSLALTPPMGWSSWNCFNSDISEQKIREIADFMVSTGMKDAGYEYLNIDDCWQIGRDEDGNAQSARHLSARHAVEGRLRFRRARV